MDPKEEEIFSVLSKKFSESGIMVDIGGFTGGWTETARSISGKEDFYIFEPNIENYESIKRRFIGKEKIKIINEGLGEVEGEFTYFNLLGSDNIRGMSGFVKREIYSNYPYEEIKIKISTLDNSIPKDLYIDFIKVDVEGYELNVIKGMKDILESGRVKFIQFEYGGTYFDAGIKMNDVIEIFDSYGYKVFDYSNSQFRQLDSFVDDFNYNNLIATKEIL
jgi:FkbM family methyltransferase